MLLLSNVHCASRAIVLLVTFLPIVFILGFSSVFAHPFSVTFDIKISVFSNDLYAQNSPSVTYNSISPSSLTVTVPPSGFFPSKFKSFISLLNVNILPEKL